jgi:hypothetical protein
VTSFLQALVLRGAGLAIAHEPAPPKQSAVSEPVELDEEVSPAPPPARPPREEATNLERPRLEPAPQVPLRTGQRDPSPVERPANDAFGPSETALPSQAILPAPVQPVIAPRPTRDHAREPAARASPDPPKRIAVPRVEPERKSQAQPSPPVPAPRETPPSDPAQSRDAGPALVQIPLARPLREQVPAETPAEQRAPVSPLSIARPPGPSPPADGPPRPPPATTDADTAVGFEAQPPAVSPAPEPQGPTPTDRLETGRERPSADEQVEIRIGSIELSVAPPPPPQPLPEPAPRPPEPQGFEAYASVR